MDSERRRRWLVAGTIFCVSAWLGDTFVFTPLLNLWRERAARIQELDEEIAKDAGLLDREGDLRARWEDMKKRALPKRVSDAEQTVFEAVNQWTADSGIGVTSLKPRWTRVDRDKQTFEIQLEGNGDMQAAAKFVYDLESSNLPLRVEDFGIVSQDEKGGHLNLSLRFTGIVLAEVSP